MSFPEKRIQGHFGWPYGLKTGDVLYFGYQELKIGLILQFHLKFINLDIQTLSFYFESVYT